MAEQNKYDMNENNTSKDDFLKYASNELRAAFCGIALGAPVQYKKDTLTGLEKMALAIPNGKGNGFTPCVFTFGMNDCIGNSAFNAICKNTGIYDIIYSDYTLDQKIEKLVDRFDRPMNLKKGNSYSKSFLENKLYEFRTKLEIYSPDINKMYSNAENKLVGAFSNKYAVESNNKSKNQTAAQQGK